MVYHDYVMKTNEPTEQAKPKRAYIQRRNHALQQELNDALYEEWAERAAANDDLFMSGAMQSAQVWGGVR